MSDVSQYSYASREREGGRGREAGGTSRASEESSPAIVAVPPAEGQRARGRLPPEMEEAKEAVDSLLTSTRDLEVQVRGAVYVEESLFQQATQVAAVQNSNRRLQQQVIRLREQVDSGHAALAKSTQRCKALEDRAQFAEQQLAMVSDEQESTTAVFELHRQELLRKQTEIDALHEKVDQLNNIIAVLSGGGGKGSGGSGKPQAASISVAGSASTSSASASHFPKSV